MPANSQNALEKTRTHLFDCSLIKAIDLTSKGHIRMQTSFLYPDGSHVDIFIKKNHGLLASVEPLLITDFGTTFAWLSNAQVHPKKSKRRAAVMDDILATYGIRLNGSSLELHTEDNRLSEAIIRLGQACLRLSDMYYSARYANYGRFKEELEEILTDMELEFTADDTIAGRFGNIVRVDFRIHALRTESAILTLPADKYPSQARSRAEHVYAVFSDLVQWSGQRVAALDDRSRAYSETDLERIATVATVVHVFADRQSLQELLRAA